MIRARLATAEEASPFLKAGYDTIGFILEDDELYSLTSCDYGKTVKETRRKHKIGHVWLSANMGQTFAHDLVVKSSDKQAAVALLHAVRTHLLRSGVTEIYMHEDDESDPKVMVFWKKLGAAKVATMYRLSL
jgi:hypothetical protein